MPWHRPIIAGHRQSAVAGWVATTLLGFWIAPVYGEAPPHAADRQASRADDAVRVGAEFFLNRTETADSVAHHFRMMKDYGLRSRGSS